MNLNIAGEQLTVLFDGKRVYDENNKLVVALKAACGQRLSQSILQKVCAEKMQKLQVVCNAMTGRWMTEAKGTPYGCSVGDEAYWCN